MTNFQTKTYAQFRDDFLRSVSNALQTIAGIPNLDVSYGTDHYIIGEAIGKLAEITSYNVIAAADAQMIDTATGADLYRLAGFYGLSLKPAGGSSGFITFSASNTVAIVQGTQLIDGTGLKYQVAAGGTYANGASIPITSVDTGTGTNLATGSSLRWVSAPAFSAPTALVASPGLSGGSNAETDDQLRARVLSRLQNPPGGGNWSQFAQLAMNSSTQVQQAFVYPVYNGPSTVQVCVVTAPTSSNKNRNVNSLIVSGTVNPAIQAGVFEGMSLLTTTAVNKPIDLSVGLSLPSAVSASPPGIGGGWTDGQPFPVNASQGYANVASVSSTNIITIVSDVPPVVNTTKVCWLSKDDWTLRTATVISSSGSGTYTIGLDTPFVSVNGVSIAANDYVFPNAVNVQNYINAILDYFASLGPGQILNPGTVTNLFPYAYRRPFVGTAYPSDIGPSLLKLMNNVGPEVYDAQYLGSGARKCPFPTNVTSGPYILVPGNLGVYPI